MHETNDKLEQYPLSDRHHGTLFVVYSNFCVISHYVLKYQNWTRMGTEPVTVPYLALPKLTPMAASQMTLQH